MQLQLENPSALFGLLFVVGLAALMFWKKRHQPDSFSWRRLTLTCAAFTLCMLGLSRPQLGQRLSSSVSKSGNVFFAVDISRSMGVQDTSPSRIQFAVAFAQKLLQQLNGVKVAIFPFAVDGYLQIPLTNDLFAASDMISSLGPSMTTQQGTDISQALSTLLGHINRLERATRDKGGEWPATQVVLFSDGETHHPLRPEVVKEYRKQRIPIFVVATGTTTGGYVPLEGRYGMGKDRLRDNEGKLVQSRLMPDVLKQLSQLSGGDYFSPRFEEVYRLKDRLVQAMTMGKLTTNFKLEKEYFPTLFLLALLVFLTEFYFGRWEYAVRSIVFTCLLLSSLWATPALAEGTETETPASAIENYNKGVAVSEKDPSKAAEYFQESIMGTEDPEVRKKAFFNLGNSLLKMGDPLQALQSYQVARDIKTGDKKLDQEANQRISENITLAAKILEEMKKQAANQPDEGDPNDNKDGKKGKADDPKGPKKDYQAQLFNDEQKKKMFDLLKSDEQQTMQRIQEQRNRNKASPPTDKPW